MTDRRQSAITSTLVVLAFALIWASATHASAPIREFGVTPSTTQAGGHPDIRTLIWTHNRATQIESGPGCNNCRDPRDIVIDMPAGVIGDPHATPQCTQSDFATIGCPIDSQVGFSFVGVAAMAPAQVVSYPIGVFNLIPRPGQAGLLGFFAPYLESPIYLVIGARTESDYGLNVTTAGITHFAPLSVVDLTLWGVPADPANDPKRLQPIGCDSQGTSSDKPACSGGAVSNSPQKAFLNNPTTCGVPLTAFAEVVAFDKEVSNASAPYPATTGCDQLSFNPSLFGQPTTKQADSASGLDVDLRVPQGGSPSVPAASEIRATEVTLPEGFSINANAANGKVACTDAEAKFGTREQAECPEFAKVGTLEVTSSSLPGPLPGYVYLGEPKPGDRYRLILVADGFGLHVKLPASARPDPGTGRVTTSFQDLPQFPFSRFNLHFFGSERGLLATPSHCGTYPVESTFTPWNDRLPEQSSTQFFVLDAGPNGQPCPGTPRPFDPSIAAGVSDKTAGAHPRLSLDLTREDGEQLLQSLSVTTPPGLAATLAGIPYCSEAAIAATGAFGYTGLIEQISPQCPVASQIGTAIAGAGAGSRPLYLPGKVYLAGPYKGAPLSLVVVTPAVSGPYDLGSVVVRARLDVDSSDARVTTTSDPLPQIVEGIPLRLRSIRIQLDRDGFMLNPTNCSRYAIGTTIAGDEGTQLTKSTHFQVANCADLPYEPKLRMTLRGGVKRRGHPAIQAVLTTKPGEANSSRVSVSLPKGELLDNSHIGTVCTRPAFADDACPPGSQLGTATAFTPLFDQPLKGNIYLRSSSNPLPDIVVDLEGQVDIALVGRIDTAKGGALRTRFEAVPDAPVTKFVLNLLGGRKGLLQNSENLCGAGKKASVRMVGQNGKSFNQAVPLNPACGKRKGA